MRSNDSHFFSVLSLALGLIAATLALVAVTPGVLPLALLAFAATTAGLLHDEGAGALLGGGVALTALLGPASVVGALLAAAVVFAATRGMGHPRT